VEEAQQQVDEAQPYADSPSELVLALHMCDTDPAAAELLQRSTAPAAPPFVERLSKL